MGTSLEQQIEELAACGLGLNPGIAVEDLLVSFDREDYEVRKPYALLVQRMGGEVEAEPRGRRISDAVWQLDTRCVDGSGAYGRLLRELARMSGMSERVTKISDHVDLEKDEAWVAYVVGEKSRRWTCEVRQRWLDLMVLSYMIDDLEHDDRFFASWQSGQMLLFVFVNEEQLKRLRDVTKLDFTRFNDV